MKAAFIRDIDADLDTCTDAQKALVKFRFAPGTGKPDAYFPRGTEISGPWALQICVHGQGTPLDDECKAAIGISDTELNRRQLVSEMAEKGINDKADQELYKAKVILGYDDQLNYIHGPNWDAYQKAKAEQEKVDDIE